MNLKEKLQGSLSKNELDSLRRSYDIIGSIAVIEVPPELQKKQKLIAKAVLGTNKNIFSVYKKTGKRTDILRVPRLVYVAGKRSTEIRTGLGRIPQSASRVGGDRNDAGRG